MNLLNICIVRCNTLVPHLRCFQEVEELQDSRIVCLLCGGQIPWDEGPNVRHFTCSLAKALPKSTGSFSETFRKAIKALPVSPISLHLYKHFSQVDLEATEKGTTASMTSHYSRAGRLVWKPSGLNNYSGSVFAWRAARTNDGFYFVINLKSTVFGTSSSKGFI